jgi:thymidylate kinase
MRQKLIIVEGPQGVGKTTVTNWLRENLKYSNLFRLTGLPDKSIDGKVKCFMQHANLIEYLFKQMELCEFNAILDRSFFTEYVYCKLGYKPYTFDEETNLMCESLQRLSKRVNVFILSLTVRDNEYETRLKRDKFEYVKFDQGESIRQAEEYSKIFKEVSEEYKGIKAFNIDTTEGQESWIKQIKEVLKL